MADPSPGTLLMRRCYAMEYSTPAIIAYPFLSFLPIFPLYPRGYKKAFSSIASYLMFTMSIQLMSISYLVVLHGLSLIEWKGNYSDNTYRY